MKRPWKRKWKQIQIKTQKIKRKKWTMNSLNASFSKKWSFISGYRKSMLEKWGKISIQTRRFCNSELGKKRLLNRRNASSTERRLRYQDFPQKPKKIGKLRLGIITHWEQKSMNSIRDTNNSRIETIEIGSNQTVARKTHAVPWHLMCCLWARFDSFTRHSFRINYIYFFIIFILFLNTKFITGGLIWCHWNIN